MIFRTALLLSVFAFIACSSGNEKKQTMESDQIAHVQEATFTVYGACGMCKDRIEKTASGFEGVQSAEWDIEANMLTLSYDPEQVNLDNVHNKLAAAGHDTDEVKASDEVYEALPACCHYRE